MRTKEEKRKSEKRFKIWTPLKGEKGTEYRDKVEKV